MKDINKIKQLGKADFFSRTGKAIALLGVVFKLLDGTAKANEVGDILANSEEMKRAVEFAKRGELWAMRAALIGSGEPRYWGSVYEKLYGVNPQFAYAFRAAVEQGLNNIQKGSQGAR